MSFIRRHGIVLDKARGRLYLLRYFYFIYSSFFFYILSIFFHLYPEDGDKWLPQNFLTCLPTKLHDVTTQKIKGKIQPRTGHKAQRGSRVIDLDGGWVVIANPRPLYTQERYPVPIVQEAGWAPGPVWTGAGNLALTGILFPDCPARSESLYRLSSSGPPPQNTKLN